MCQLSIVTVLLLLTQEYAFFQALTTSIPRNRLCLNDLAGGNNWLQSSEVKNNDNKIMVINKSECTASSSIKRGEILFALPQSLCLDADSANKKFGTVLKTSTLRTGQLGVAALLLLAERASGRASKYAPYINSLPQHPRGVLGWSDAETAEFVTSTTRAVQYQLGAIEDDIDAVLRVDLSPVLPPSSLNREALRWAIGTIKARAVYVNELLRLVPGMDYIYFDPVSDCEPQLESTGVFGGKVIRLRADRDYAPGDRVYMSFGLKGAAECVEDHGFCPLLDSPNACCELSVEIEEGDKYSEDKMGILEMNGLSRVERFDLEARPGAAVDPELLRFLRLKLIEGKDSFILESCFSQTVFETLAQPFSRVNEMRVHEWVRDKCTALLARLEQGGAEAADTQLLEKDQWLSAARQTAAVGDAVPDYESQPRDVALALLRSQERAALRNTVSIIEAVLKELQGPDLREYYQERRLKDLDLLRPLVRENNIIKKAVNDF